MSFSARLREERRRLGLTQKQLAAMLGVKEQSQVAYEKDKLPKFARYLEMIAQLGVDVSYIITGDRGGVKLSPEEAEILTLFRQASPAVRKTASDVLRSGIVITKQVHVGRDNFGDITI